MSFFKKVREFFGGKPEPQGLIIQPGLPAIDARRPIVCPPTHPELKPKTAEDEAMVQEFLNSCSVCKFGLHDPNLDDLSSVLCTLDPNKPKVVLLQNTCLEHISKYPKIKVIVDKGTLLEYDSDRADTRTPKGYSTGGSKGIIEIGEEEW